MKFLTRHILTLAFLTGAACAQAADGGGAHPDFDTWLADSTLRVDYVLTGNAHEQHIAVSELRRSDGWFGRRCRLDSVPLRGNGRITMRDAETQTVIYATTFSTLFQEWETTEEAAHETKSFESSFLLPMPHRKAEVEVALIDFRGQALGRLVHSVDPADILIRPCSATPAPHRVLHSSDSRKAIDIAIVAEGYTADEAELFYADAQRVSDEILRYEPFSRYTRPEGDDAFCITAVALASEESGVSIPHDDLWKNTALSSSFDTFYSDRYLTTLRQHKLHDALSGIPYEHIIILANTDNYGGGGIYNSYTLVAAHNAKALPVAVHEFGHSFGGLADEYFYDDMYEQFYYPEVEPWEQNITTLADFGSKWADMLPEGARIPTPTDGLKKTDMRHIGVYEGGGYQSKGVYRPYMDCRMKTNEVKEFCEVCKRALSRIIEFYINE